ncbi:MAG: hypothetical protein QT11_C0001G0936 [archaeon GW2011_AR20]|nr:MAG: hypothetical protein QT11_C0001G0936 [archaeon GW2011_AR20]MBS3160161.1 hypothetical protein [Candidatus Woesearchaeota archaeon]
MSNLNNEFSDKTQKLIDNFLKEHNCPNCKKKFPVGSKIDYEWDFNFKDFKKNKFRIIVKCAKCKKIEDWIGYPKI